MFVAERKMLAPTAPPRTHRRADRPARATRSEGQPQHDEDRRASGRRRRPRCGRRSNAAPPHQTPAGARALRDADLGGIGATDGHRQWMPLKSRPHKYAKPWPLTAHCIFERARVISGGHGRRFTRDFAPGACRGRSPPFGRPPSSASSCRPTTSAPTSRYWSSGSRMFSPAATGRCCSSTIIRRTAPPRWRARSARPDERVRCMRRIGRRGLAGACLEGMLASQAQLPRGHGRAIPAA